MSVAIIGGGWAGLATAVELHRHNIPFTLYEATDTLGGRARRLDDSPWPLDCGHHLMLGAYHNVQRLLASFGKKETRRLKRHLLRLDIRGKSQRITIQIANVSPPLHLFLGLLRAQGLTMHERGTILRLTARLARNQFEINEDVPLAEWLRQQGQTRNLIDFLWRPLCLAAMSTPIENASSKIFIHVLKECFAHAREDSDILLFDGGISQALPRLVQQRFASSIQYQQPLQAFTVERNRINTLHFLDKTVQPQHVILATPASISQQLLSPHDTLRPVCQQIANIDYQPICTVYLKYPPHITLATPMIGLVGGLCQWAYDQQQGHIAVVIRGPGAHTAMEDGKLFNEVSRELHGHFPRWPAPSAWHIVREQNATFNCRSGVAQYRPQTDTPIDNLWLAGDYLDTGYPACVEGAAISGIRSAQAVIRALAPQSAASA